MTFVYQRSYRGPLQAVIVDWAGTILDFGSRAPLEAFRATFGNAGVEITAAEAREPMGLAKRDHIRAITRMPRVAEAWRAAHNRAPAEDDVEQLYARFLPLQLAVLGEHARAIGGTAEAFAAFRARGLKIGSTTGYVQELMDVLMPLAERQGLHVDAMVCASDVPMGRPAPFMCWANATRLGVFPSTAMVKIGDTVADVEEGLSAGMWSIGVSRTGNEVGLSEEEQRALAPDELAARVAAASSRLARAGAHYVVEGIGDCPAVVDEIARRVAQGDRPW
jgi:phosphonoacetaldehyde hydrolase